jgi:hypothetical protein
MASKSSSAKKSNTGAVKSNGTGAVKSNGAGKPRVSAQQKKMRAQQVGMGIFAMILVVAMILSLVVR